MTWKHSDGLIWLEPGMVHELVLWIFLISGIVALVIWIAGFFHRGAAQPSPQRALDILKTRYAKGETGREQLDQMKREPQS